MSKRNVSLFLTPLILHSLIASEPASISPRQLQTLHHSLQPDSIRQQLAFYELYPDTIQGRDSLAQAWRLLSGTSSSTQQVTALPHGIDGIIAMVAKPRDASPPELSPDDLVAIDKLASRLPNRRLKGFRVGSDREVLILAPEEIDLTTGLLLAQYPDDPHKRRLYEAQIDLMALQLLAVMPESATPIEKIDAINRLVFDEMQFRFPPHSLYSKEIDQYTFLSSVLDSRRGVCLGVSLLYLCLAQRLNLPLEIVTPPGHIYVRYCDGERVTNIETTARGVHIPNEVYLSPDTRSLQMRDLKETIGLIYVNQASVFWQVADYAKATETYEKAMPYLANDAQLKELLGYQYILLGHIEQGEGLLREVAGHLPDHAVSKETMAEDYLAGRVDAEGIKAIFLPVDETRESVLAKKEAIEKVTAKWPLFRAGVFQQAVVWLQLHRATEAINGLEAYHTLDPKDPTAEYYLAVLYTQRAHYGKAWQHLENAEALAAARNHYPKAFRELRRHLAVLYAQ